MENYLKYAALIQQQIGEMFHDDCENYINPQEFNDPEKFKGFIHALSTVVPCSIFNKITDDQNDHLQFNHIANHLVFEYAKSVDNDSDDDAQRTER